jgi:UDP-glucose 4-epimerase
MGVSDGTNKASFLVADIDLAFLFKANAMSIKTILITGGLGYIGSYTIISLLQASMSVIVLDNLCNSKKEVVEKIEFITKKPICFIAGYIRDLVTLKAIFAEHPIDAVIHFA